MPSTDDYLLLLPNRFRERQFLHKVAATLFVCVIFFSVSFFVSSYFQSKYTKPSILSCKKPDYDYDLLAVRWTPTFCSYQKCINSTEDWDIHGLWPSWKNKSQGPQFCCRSWGFSQTEITSLISELNEQWPNQKQNQSLDSLWKHEWTKHGTCSNVARSGGMIAYFNTTLSLFAKYPLEKWLNNSGIIPTPIEDKFAYDIDKIHQTIENNLGDKTITIQCKQSKSIPLLDTIYLCFHPSTMDLINCPPDRCKGAKKVILPKSR